MEIPYTSLELGEIHLADSITKTQRLNLKTVLHTYGLELMEDEKAILVEKIVTIIINMTHESDEFPPTNFSIYLTNQLNEEYHYLSALFSKTKGITIEHFIILHKVERVKELIIYDELSLSEIAFKMHCRSAAHLSNQFKKVTGLTPTFFKQIKNKRRIPIEELSAST